jgi:Protein of unknown function (DUF998)
MIAQKPAGWRLVTENTVRSFASPHLADPPSKVRSRFLGLGKVAAVVSIVATAYFLTAAVGAHVVMTQYNFFADYISDYAVGPWGWIYGSAFLASAIGSIALAASLVLLLPSQALSRIGVVLLVLVGVTYAVDFAFPTDILPPGAPPTTAVGIVHLLDALLGWVLFTGGSVLISSSLRHAAYWKVWQPLLTTLLGSLCCFLSCSLASSFPRRHSPDLPRSSSYWIATSGRSLWASWPSGRPTAFSPWPPRRRSARFRDPRYWMRAGGNERSRRKARRCS